MCLSTVYLDDAISGRALMEEVARVIVEGKKVELQTIFGEKKTFNGYEIKEVDLVRNIVLLVKGGDE